MISVDNLTISFGGYTLLRDITFVVNNRDKIGLVGRNGAGKTTLLRIFMGLQQPDEGQVVIPNGTRLGYLPQQMVTKDGKTLFEEAETAFEEIMALDHEIRDINREIAGRDDYESSGYNDLLEQLADKTERYHLLEGDSRNQKIEQVLDGLGFYRSDFNRPTREFSGGWRMRIELAKILLISPDVILLDEPTNHLDIDSIQWLEVFLGNYHGAVILISHDRMFLDRVTNRTIEIILGRIHDYRVSYSKYVMLRKERREQQIAAYRNQQKKIEDTREFIERFRYKATKSVQVQSRIKMLEKMEMVEIDEEDVSSLQIRFPSSPRAGKVILEIRDLSFSYDLKPVLKHVDLNVIRGDRIAFVGRNGEGKTTLARIISGELPDQGSITRGYHINAGYFAQNQDELLDENKSILETINEVATGEIRPKIRDLLGAFLFGGEDVDKKIKVLSGGERSRLSLAYLLLQPCNFLILDEPTNHLDMRSKDILKQALLKYNGTMIVVSHDREFLDGLVNKIYEFSKGNIKEYLGGIIDFLQKKQVTSLKELEMKEKLVQHIANPPNDGSRQSYLQKKESDREINRLKTRIRKTEDQIEDLENRLQECTRRLEKQDPESKGVAGDDFYNSYQRLQGEIDLKMELWEQLHKDLEKLKSKRN